MSHEISNTKYPSGIKVFYGVEDGLKKIQSFFSLPFFKSLFCGIYTFSIFILIFFQRLFEANITPVGLAFIFICLFSLPILISYGRNFVEKKDIVCAMVMPMICYWFINYFFLQAIPPESAVSGYRIESPVEQNRIPKQK